MDCQVFLCPGKELPVGISSPHFCLWLLRFVPWSNVPAYYAMHIRHWPIGCHRCQCQCLLQYSCAPSLAASWSPQFGTAHTYTSHRGRTLGTTAAPERCMRIKQGAFVRQESGTGPLPIRPKWFGSQFCCLLSCLPLCRLVVQLLHRTISVKVDIEQEKM